MLNKRNNQAKAIKELLKKKFNSREELANFKRKLSKKYGIKVLLNSDILKEYKRRMVIGAIHELPLQEKILLKRPVRTLSGIAAIAVLTKPYTCPGQCIYCPTEKNVPKSYLSNEPAVMRAIRCHYDPYKQVQLRLRALEANGHRPNKIELIVIGGTWSVLPRKYKYWFIKECFRAANNSKTLKSLQLQQKDNERAKNRIIGIMVETRPDFINKKEIKRLRTLGITAVELGVQSIYNDVLKKNKRGHLLQLEGYPGHRQFEETLISVDTRILVWYLIYAIRPLFPARPVTETGK